MPTRSRVVRRIEAMPVSWALKSYMFHRAGYTNKGGRWHKVRGAARTRVRRLGGIRKVSRRKR